MKKCSILVFCIMQFIFVHSMKHIEIECDSISNTDFGRRFCFIRHINMIAIQKQNVTFKPNPIAEEKNELIFDNCTIDTIPLGIFEYLPNIKTVYGWNMHLQSVNMESFRNGKKLLVLDLSKNQIRELHQNAFHFAEQLIQLDLSRNILQSIHANAFSGLEKLNFLNLEYNKIELIPANSFTPLLKLKSIRMSHNLIKMIPVELFEQNIQLQNIYLNDNAIEWLLGEQTFRHLANVNEFDLHNNPIANLGCCVINAQSIDIRQTNSMGCYIGSKTKRILANNNQISFIDSNDATPTNLKHVEMRNNRLSKMDNLTRFEKLIHLDLTNNTISDIGINSFAKMDRLEQLYLRNSGLSNISFGLFSHKPKLKFLDISYNNLNQIDFRLFVSLNSLQKLYLDGNNITELDAAEIRKIFPALFEISILENNWNCKNLSNFLLQLQSSGIAIKSFGTEKNSENIAGIPCSAMKNTTKETNITQNANHVENTKENICSDSKSIVTEKVHRFNIPDMQIIVRLLELKYEIQIITQSANEIAKKLENILALQTDLH